MDRSYCALRVESRLRFRGITHDSFVWTGECHITGSRVVALFVGNNLNGSVLPNLFKCTTQKDQQLLRGKIGHVLNIARRSIELTPTQL